MSTKTTNTKKLVMLAMLAAIGLATLLWLAVSVFLRLRRETLHHVVAMVPARGAANGLEHTVRTLEQLRYEQGGFGSIVIVDCGLNEVGRQVAALLRQSASEITELYYVKKDASRLTGITTGFDL